MLQKLSKAASVFLVLALFACIVFAPTPIQADTAGDSSFMTAPLDSGSAASNTHNGYIGYQFVVAKTVIITALGRPDLIGGAAMTQNHEVSIYNGNSTRKLVATVTVTPSSPMKDGYRCENLATPVKLVAGEVYFFVAAEYSGVDYWFNGYAMTDKFDTSVVSQVTAAYSGDYSGVNIGLQGGPGVVHNALNFWYMEVPAPVSPAGDDSFVPLPLDLSGVSTGNTHSGYLGFTFTAKSNVTLTALGRPEVVGGAWMTHDHEVAIWEVQWNSDRTAKSTPVLLGKVTVKPTSPAYEGYCYESLTRPVNLKKDKEYIIASAEYAGVDNWVNWQNMAGKYDPAVVSEIDAVYAAGYNGQDIGMQNPGTRGQDYAHSALNFWYVSTPAPVPPAGDDSFMPLPLDLTGAATGNTHDGYMGFTFKAESNITLTALGRPDVVGNAAMMRDHEVAVWEVQWNSDRTEKSTPVLLGKVTIKPTSPEYDGYCYENLSTPVNLKKGREYIIASTEYSGTDNWVNGYDMTGKFDADVVSEIDAVYAASYNGQDIGMQNPGTRGSGLAHGALNFWYAETPAPVLVPPAGDDSFMPLPLDLTGAATGNTHSGYMGFTFKAESNITLTALGRPDFVGGAAMARDHEVSIWEVQWNSDRTEKSTPVLLGKVTVKPTSVEYEGYRYENLSAPIDLKKGKEYILVSAEYDGTDNWVNGYNMAGKFDPSVVSEIDAVYAATYNGQDIGLQDPGKRGQGFAHGALNFWYAETPAALPGPKPIPPAGNDSLMNLPLDLTGAATGNTHSGYMGFTFKAESDIFLTALGRPDVVGGAAMTRDHEVSIWEVQWNSDRTEKSAPVLLGKVTVKPTSIEYEGYRYENLKTPVKLEKGKEYILVSAEYAGSDNWVNGYDMTGKYNTRLISEIDAVYSADYEGQNIGLQNPGTRGQGFAHGALNFWYATEVPKTGENTVNYVWGIFLTTLLSLAGLVVFRRKARLN